MGEDGGRGRVEAAQNCGQGHLLLVCHLPTPAIPVLAIPDSNKEQQCPRDTVEGDIGQEEAGVEAGSPEQVL